MIVELTIFSVCGMPATSLQIFAKSAPPTVHSTLFNVPISSVLLFLFVFQKQNPFVVSSFRFFSVKLSQN